MTASLRPPVDGGCRMCYREGISLSRFWTLRHSAGCGRDEKWAMNRLIKAGGGRSRDRG